MYDEFDGPEKPSRSRLRTAVYVTIIAIIIVGLLGSAGAAVLWFSARQPESTPEQIVVPTTPHPSPTPSPTSEAGDEPVVEVPSLEDAHAIGRIAYVSSEGQVATISPDGENGRLLSEAGLRFQFPAWSPDGRYLAAIGSNSSGGGVFLLEDRGDSDESQELFFSRSETPIYLYWSPNSRIVSFLANHPTDVLGMHLLSVDPREDERLLVTGSPLYWDWAAGSDEIMVHIGFAGEDARLSLIDAFGDGQGPNITSPGFFQAPDISSDGRFLAYAEETSEGQSQVTIMDTQTESHQQERHAGLVAMGWSSAGDQLAIISGVPEANHFYGPLRLLDAVSGETRLLTRKFVLAFFWSPDGRYIAYVSAPGASDDLQAAIPSREDKEGITLAKPVPSFGRSTGDPFPVQQPSPLLLELSIIEAATGQTRSFATFEPTRTFLSQYLPFFDQYALSHRVWSPSNDAVVFPMHIDGDDRIVVLPVNGEDIRQIADGNMPFWSHQ